jgi:hypothetical protein
LKRKKTCVTREVALSGVSNVASARRQKTVQQYNEYRFEALQRAAITLDTATKADFTLTEMTWTAIEAWKSQWTGVRSRDEPDGGWDWESIRTLFRRDPKRFEVAVWSHDKLCGLAVGTLNKTATVVEVLEGHPDPTHPLRGEVLLIVLQAATTYAQRTGRPEVWLMEPAEGLIHLYEKLGFSLETPKRGKRYCRRKV